LSNPYGNQMSVIVAFGYYATQQMMHLKKKK